MASLAKSATVKEEPVSSPASPVDQVSTGPDAQSYLISKYREALKRGDKSDAKSCLMAARYFSVNDPNVTNEIYMMAKSDGDVIEASKCFAKIFTDLFINQEQSSIKTNTQELATVMNQTKEEIRVLLNELKSYFLKLKAQPASAALVSRQIPSIVPSPLLSPRVRMSSEDRSANIDSLSKLDNHLNTSSRSFFYQQLFENLPETIKMSFLEHSIENCDNPFESCRLMILALSIFNGSVSNYGSRLLHTLTSLSDPDKKLDDDKQAFPNPRSSIMCNYAKNLLVLDAIPLVLSILPISSLEFDVEELFERTLNFYSNQYLETSSAEYEADELHEWVKKSIAVRILGIEHNSALEEAIEDQITSNLSQLSQRHVELMPNSTTKTKLEKIRVMIADRTGENNKSDALIELIHELNLEDANLDESKDDPCSATTPPPKSRGRPKRTQQVSQDSGVKKNSTSRLRGVQHAFYSIVQHMFINCAIYLKKTRSRVLLNFDNPLAVSIESELTKNSIQRTSRSKANSQQNVEQERASTKKIRLDSQYRRLNQNLEKTPLNSEQSKMVDRSILTALIEASKCLEFLQSNYGPFTKLWQKFVQSNNIDGLYWYRRFSVDSSILFCKYDIASNLLQEVLKNQQDDPNSTVETVSTRSIMPNSSLPNVAALRSLVQLLSCGVQLSDKTKTFDKINELLAKVKQSELLSQDDNYASGNIIEEYMVIVPHEEQRELGFLFFDSLSMIRYAVDILMDIMKRYSTNNGPITDTALGHTIVLSQIDWPKEASIYNHCISWLRQQKPKSTTPQCLSASTKFTYPEFFQYIRNPNIIEDFMAMLSQGYTLDIKSNGATGLTSAAQGRGGNYSQGSGGSSRNISNNPLPRSGKAITTRGVNKSFKEDLKVALIAQMKNSSFLISLEMISEFIQSLLIPYLTATKK